MNPQIYQDQTQSGPLGMGKKQWLLAGLLLLLLMVLVVFLWPKPELETHSLVDVNLKKEDNFTHLEDNAIYGYNGAAFYRRNLTGGQNTDILLSGVKLPKPEDVAWAGDKGALVTFAESFTATKVQDKIRSLGEELDEFTQNYTWYIDFSDGSLTKVSNAPINEEDVYYSPEQNGIYFVPDWTEFQEAAAGLHGLEEAPAKSLEFFSINSKKTNKLVQNLNMVDVNGLAPCPGYSVCALGLGSSGATQKLFGIDNSGNKTEVMDSGGRLFATNDPSLYVAVPFGESDQDHAGDSQNSDNIEELHEDPYMEEQPALLRSISDDSVKELGFSVTHSDVIAGFGGNQEDKSFYALTPQSALGEEEEIFEYYAGRLEGRFGQTQMEANSLEYYDGEDFGAGLLSFADYGSDKDVLVTTFEGNDLLFTTKVFDDSIFPFETNNAKQVVDGCVAQHAEGSQYFEGEAEFWIYINYNDQFNSNIKKFSGCITGSEFDTVAAYNFKFGGLSPVNGRIVTD